MNIAFSYRRTSTSKQDNSLAAQESHCEEYCRRNAFDQVFTFDDPDVSSRTALKDRDGGGRMLIAIKRATLEHPDAKFHLVVIKQDRLGRDTIDQITTIRQLWDWNVLPHLVLETGPLPKNPSNQFLFEVKASANQYERNQIRERIKTTLDHRKAQGYLTGTVPYGKDAVPTGEVSPNTRKQIYKLVDNQYEQQWIAQMKQWKEDGFSHWDMARKLNEAGVPMKVKAGTLRTVRIDKRSRVKLKAPVQGTWKPISVWRILNPGKRKRKGKGNRSE